MFKDLQADPVAAAEIMETLNVDMDTLSSPKTMKQLQDIVEFFSPYENRLLAISKLAGAKPGLDKLGHLSEYIQLRKMRDKRVDEIDALANVMEPTDEVSGLILLKKEQVSQLEKQISKFE